MKRILLLLLLATFSIQAQTLQNPTYGNVKLKNNTTDNSATKVNVQSTDGTINTISKSDLVNVVEVNGVPTLPLVGEVGKIYVVKNVNKIYRWNGTFYQELAGSDISGLQAQIDLKAPLASPSLTGTPTAPTAIAGTNTTQIATTAFVLANASVTPNATTSVKGIVKLAGDLGGTADLPTVPALATKADLASPTFTGTPTAPTPTLGTNTTQIATTAFVAGGLAIKENAFTKNTAFNKNFGTTAGTVVEGGTLGSNAYSSTAYLPLNGTGANGTWGINISGNAGTATNSSKWNNQNFEFAGIGSISDYIIGKGADGTWRPASASETRYWLGLGSNAYSSTAYLPLSGGTLTGIVTAPTATAGTNTTQIATTAFVLENSSARPYKVYTALLSQSGTNAPVATVLENTLGGTVVWTRGSVGLYIGTLDNGFSSTLSKVRIFISGGEPSQNATGFYNALPNNIDSVQVNTRNTSGSLADSLMSTGATIEIRVYN